jgi:hypothetical protein
MPRVRARLHMCLYTAVYRCASRADASSSTRMPRVRARLYMCLYTAVYRCASRADASSSTRMLRVRVRLDAIYVSSYHCVCVLTRLYMGPDTAVYVS